MVRVKICGITNKEDALKASRLGAWALGFVFTPKSPRYIPAQEARKIIAAIPPFVTAVGVFVNETEETVKHVADLCGIKTLQFHGDETPLYCGRFKGYQTIKAFRVKEGFDFGILNRYAVSGYLLDTYQENLYGGSGKTFGWEILKGRKFPGPLILSGGLNPQNIRQAMKIVQPYAVDVSSGVEKSPGKKGLKLLSKFFSRIND